MKTEYPPMESSLPLRPTKEEAQQAIKTILSYVGDDPTRPGVIDTPARVIKAYDELFCGYTQNPYLILDKNFHEKEFSYDEIILLKDIPFISWCQHHMQKIEGVVHFGYIPDQHIVGLSKIPRLVDCYAKRLQVQEHLTLQIADTFNEIVKPRGCGAVIVAEHGCMSCRGVSKRGITTTTSRLIGSFRTDPSTKAEFLALIGK